MAFGMTLGIYLCFSLYIDCGTWSIVIVEKMVSSKCHFTVLLERFDAWHSVCLFGWSSMLLYIVIGHLLTWVGFRVRAVTDVGSRDSEVTWVMWVVLPGIWRQIDTRHSWFLCGGGPRQWNKCPTHLLCMLNLSPVAHTLRQSVWCECCLSFLVDSVFSFSMGGSRSACM